MAHKRRGKRAREERQQKAMEQPQIKVWLPRRFEIEDPIHPGRLVIWADYRAGKVVGK